MRQQQVSDNPHFLVYDNGSIFLYLVDRAWGLFNRLGRAIPEAPELKLISK
jgi:hypothetical protein